MIESGPSFDKTAPLGRLTLLVGAYAPMLAVLGLRIGFDTTGIVLCVASTLATTIWLIAVLVIVKGRQAWDATLVAAEPVDRDVAAYVASYLLPILAAKPGHFTGYLAYGLAAVLLLVVAYRADLGAINPIAYAWGFRAYRVSAEDGVRIVVSRSLLLKDTSWELRQVAGVVVATKQVPTSDR